MVRRLALRGSIDCLEPQAAFSFLYGDDQFMRLYHKEANEDPDIEVSSWTADGQRTVTFTAPLNAPALVRKIVGSDLIRIREVQEYERVGNCFTIKSDPTTEGAAGELFSTKGQIVLAPAESGNGCSIMIDATLECKTSIWGVQGTTESFMEVKAKKSFENWMAIARKFCEEQVALAGQALLPFTCIEEEESHSSDDDKFYDPEDREDVDDQPHNQSADANEQRTISQAIEGRVSGGAEPLQIGSEGKSELDMWFVKSVMRELNCLRISSEAAQAHLVNLGAKLQRLEDDVGFMKSKVQLPPSEDRLFSPRATWTLVGLGVTTGVLLGVGHAYLKSKSER